MKSTSPNSKSSPRIKPKPRVKVSAITEEERVMRFLKSQGARPMTREEKAGLAAAGCLGMPDE